MTARNRVLQIHPEDNVAVAAVPIEARETVMGFTAVERIPAGHKVAVRDIAAGEAVIKYGYTIGLATQPIGRGSHVHTHNVASALKGDLAERVFSGSQARMMQPRAPEVFHGYRRPDGRVGIRNEIWVIPTVGCVNKTATEVAARAHAALAGRNNIDGVHAFPHPYGCSQLGDDLDLTRHALAGLVQHPNAAAVLIIGLGCEYNQVRSMLEAAGVTMGGAGDSPRLRFFNAQDVPDEIEAGVDAVEALAGYAATFERGPVPASALVLGMKCGGSDGFSGLTANPLLGRVADRLTAHGGTSLLTEVTEMFGAEDMLLRNAADAQTHDAIVRMCNEFRAYLRSFGQPIDENPSPGNKEGGLTTNADKSLGCCQKAGSGPIKRVLEYAEVLDGPLGGVGLVNCPSNDGVSSTAMTVAGAHMVLFTTGRGTPMGFPVPTLKIASNSELSRRKPGWIDFDAGRVLEEDITPEALAEELWQLVLDVASGRKLARNEVNNQREIAIWKRGVTV